MDNDTKKVALRMIPYGLYVIAAQDGDEIGAGTVNWVTQTAFDPPLLVVAVKTDASAYQAISKTGCFALNMLGKGQQDIAFGFFKPAVLEDGKLNGEPFHAGSTGSPILDNAVASVECKVVEVVEQGDHHVFLGEVVDANIVKAPEGRADEAILEMKELGSTVFYGG